MKFELDFQPQSIKPTEEGDYLLYNQCDGFHMAELYPSGFACYTQSGLRFFGDDEYTAWARLPDSTDLYEVFADKPVDGKSARDVTLERLAAQSGE